MPLIEISHLTKDFADVRAVEDLSFAIEAGTITGFLGPNGSGKTTTLRALLGLLAPTAGTATIAGRPYRRLDDPLRQVGVLLEAAAHPARSAHDHLRALAAEARVPSSRVAEVLDLVELRDAGRRRVGGFSLGMRQRLGLAAALLGDPPILVLDEPANGLDPEGIRWMRDFMRALRGEGRTILLSSHVLAEVAQVVDDIVVINRGRLVLHTPLSRLVESRRVRLSSPDAAALAAVLRAGGLDVSHAARDALIVTGTSARAIAEIAFANRLVVHELAAEAPSLEEAFFDLTEESRR
jgi:ABC-2 type transport system ATP-binding protein